MARAREPGDWGRDVASARDGEQAVGAALQRSKRIHDLQDHTRDFKKLDFTFSAGGIEISLDVKEKRQSYSRQYSDMWEGVRREDLFIVDETVYRRIIWQGGGGYLAVHDFPLDRWCYFGPWDLTLGNRKRFGRWGQKSQDRDRFLKGKMLINLGAAADQSESFSPDVLLGVVKASVRWRDQVAPYPIAGSDLPEIG